MINYFRKNNSFYTKLIHLLMLKINEMIWFHLLKKEINLLKKDFPNIDFLKIENKINKKIKNQIWIKNILNINKNENIIDVEKKILDISNFLHYSFNNEKEIFVNWWC